MIALIILGVLVWIATHSWWWVLGLVLFAAFFID